jgi:23S rRNA (uracil1939-C5)-methyltransferase
METIARGRVLALTDGRTVSAYIEDPQDERGSPIPAGIPFSLSSPSGRRYEYDFNPQHFIQANLFLLPVMIGLLEESLADLGPAKAADLFCGTGFFSLPLAAHAGQVLAVENNSSNLMGLRRNLERNKTGNVTISAADAYSTDLPAADVFVVDPPRGGLGNRLIGRMAAAAPRRVVYYSCDSATFARDLRSFSKAGFVPTVIRLIDNFPQTDHFEIFTVLEKSTG